MKWMGVRVRAAAVAAVVVLAGCSSSESDGGAGAGSVGIVPMQPLAGTTGGVAGQLGPAGAPIGTAGTLAPTAGAAGIGGAPAPGVPAPTDPGAGPAPTDPGTAGAGTTEPTDPTANPSPTDPPATTTPSPTGGYIRGPEPTRQSASMAGPFNTDSTTTGLRDPPEYGTQTLWYPTDADPPYAAIAIVPGFVSPESSIAPWGPFLASHGIVVLTIGTNSGADSPEIRSTALLAALDTLRAENVRSGSPIEGKLDESRLAVGGWSMGGGGTLLTANAHPELKAAMAICAWYLSAPFTQDQVPTLMFAGTADVLAGGMSQGFYTAIPDATPKLLMEITGADHFYANTPAGAQNQVGLYGLSWLKVFLEGDDRYRQFLPTPPMGASDFRTNVQ